MNILKKPKAKRLFSIMLSLVMVLTMMPMATGTAFAENSKPAANAVLVDNSKSFNDERLYYKNGNDNYNFTGSESDYNAHYDPNTGVLTLKDYIGGRISVGGAIQANLTIKLIGQNIVNDSIENNLNGGDITITGSGSLTVNKEGNDTNAVCGIAAGYGGSNDTGNVKIADNATVTVNTTNDDVNAGNAFGIYARESITISDNASVDITCSTPKSTSSDATCYGMFVPNDSTQGVEINTAGTIAIDVTETGASPNSYGVYASKYTLTKVGRMTAEWKGNSGKAFYGLNTSDKTFDPTTHAINTDSTHCYASYRYGAPHKVTVANSYLTGPGVKYPNGQNEYYFLVDDEITLTAPTRQVSNTDTTNIPFVKWVSDDVTIANSESQTGATFTMPSKDVAVTAKYNPFETGGEPKFTYGGYYISSDRYYGNVSITLISSEVQDQIKLYHKNDLEHSIDMVSFTPSDNTYTAKIYSDNCSADEYVVAVTYNGTTYYSDPFTVNYSNTPAEKPAESISLNKSSITLTVDEEETLTATVTPADSTDTVAWSSSNESVATVDSTGKVKAKYAGTATITAKAGSWTATCTVKVNLISVAVPTAKTGLVYTGSEQQGVPDGTGYALTGHKATNAGNHTATATLQNGYQWTDDTTESKTISLSWSIAKANPTVTAPTGLKGTKGNVLSTVTLPTGWDWKAPTTVMNTTGNQAFTAVYTPDDTTNYNTKEENLTVNVTEPAPTATVSDVTVDGNKGVSIADKEVKITLNNDEFKEINNDDDVSSWFNLPTGLTAKVKYIEQNIETGRKQGVTITISGTPTVTSNAVMAITIPAQYLVTSTSDLTVTNNNDAKYNIDVLKYQFSITPGVGMTPNTNYNQTVEAGQSITDQVYTAKDGYYFPTDYSSITTNSSGISITRNSYIQITVSGTPTTNVGVVLADATAKAKEATPAASFAANGESSGTLSNVDNTMKYSLDGGTTWIEITGTTVAIESGVIAENDIKVMKPATDDNTKLDSDVQTIDITKAATPTGVTAVDCTTDSNNDGKLTNVTTAMEYSKTDESSSSVWKPCTDTEVTGLTNGTYHVRIKANGTALASESATVVIAAYNAVKHSVTVTVNDASYGTASADKMSNVAEGEKVTLTATPNEGYVFDRWGDITPSTLTINADGTFTMPNEDVSVKAYFKPAALTGTVTITGIEKFGQTLTASVSGSNNTGSLTYKWYRDSAEIATGNSYAIAAEDIGKTLTCKVTSSVQTGTIEKATATIQKADGPAAPTGLTGVACTTSANNNGKITGVTTAMEYSNSAEFTSKTICTGTEITGLTNGTYYVRVAETATHNASAHTAVTVAAYTAPPAPGGGGFVVIPTETPAEKFVKDNLSANGAVIKTVDKDNYEQILAAADKYDKLSASDKAAVDKLLKEKAGMDMATFTAEASKVKASIAVPSSNTDKVKSLVKGLSLKASSAKLKSKSIRVTLSGSTSSLAEIKKLGYTVKYKFYRSTKKTSSYKATVTKNEGKYVNTTGKKGTMYYYKARVMVYDKAGKLVAQSELKQCKYANRKWTK